MTTRKKIYPPSSCYDGWKSTDFVTFMTPEKYLTTNNIPFTEIEFSINFDSKYPKLFVLPRYSHVYSNMIPSIDMHIETDPESKKWLEFFVTSSNGMMFGARCCVQMPPVVEWRRTHIENSFEYWNDCDIDYLTPFTLPMDPILMDITYYGENICITYEYGSFKIRSYKIPQIKREKSLDVAFHFLTNQK